MLKASTVMTVIVHLETEKTNATIYEHDNDLK